MLQHRAPRLILASASHARGKVLEDAGLSFARIPASIDEVAIRRTARARGLDAAETAFLLADTKAAQVSALHKDAVVIGADQILVCDGRWFEKPAGVDEARAQLGVLRGREHVLETAVACHRGGQRVWRDLARPVLVMRPFTSAFLDAYLAREGAAVTATVGAYRLEGTGVHLFSRVDGGHDAILGLPLLPLLEFLRGQGVLVS